MLESCINNTESSTHIPVDTASVAPEILAIDKFLKMPPEPPQMFSPLVMRPSACKFETMGELVLPTESPMPYRHVLEMP